ncbi:MAG: LysE family translocator [Alphaproteobacteria bacterium]|nr:LysE family translocator [Alphaproteobacteria bacterium]
MTPLDALLTGGAIGFAIAAPVGPIGLLCIRRSLADGMAMGFATGLGAAAADACYGAVAAFGLTAVGEALVAWRQPLGWIGGAVLLWLGLRILRAPNPAAAAEAGGGSRLRAFAGTFGLTLTNPATILSFAAVFAGFGLIAAGGFVSAAAMVGGVFLGSALWWLMLAGSVALIRRRLPESAVLWINRVSGLTIVGFGLALWLAEARRALAPG